MQRCGPELFPTISRLFGEAPIPPSWERFLREQGTPATGSRPLPFDPEIARAMARQFIAAREIQEAVLAQIDAILDDDALALAALIESHFLFDASNAEGDPRRSLIAPTDTVTPRAMLFDVPLFLARIPAIFDAHASLGIPEDETRELLEDIERWIIDYRSRHGVIGFDHARWLFLHFRSRLFQFGRLQFEPDGFGWPFRVFERKTGDGYLVLVEPEQRFRADGQFPDADLGSHFPPRDQKSDAAGATTLTITPERITGHGVDDRGAIARHTTTILRREWSEVLGPGSPVAAVHIPDSGPLESAAVTDSFERAAAFFARAEPQSTPRMFTCDSWLMDRQIDAYLGPESNIVAFQRRFLPLPLPGATDHQHFERVFGEAPGKIDGATQETALQRALVSHIRCGHSWRTSGGVAPLPTPDLTHRPE